ncbi:hypothetical protein A5320_03560 [Rheinheimera sp. SA_1]|uniref:hypothetical protein n=1 Tax=Rheinheimera sp. SA_1 TaxID=1827365 RepID=UPI0007FCBADE|nr:hypothetical protein [Rheinheimera sp. SA_1]OBP16495.1 hypothetical protein A5320_03560 [Rheinheimera sp. SA_1]
MISSLTEQQVQKKVLATAQQGAAHCDGYLSVSAIELHFAPFNQAYGLGPYHLKRNDISKVEVASGKGGGFIPMMTEAIRITMADSREFLFILAEPERWLELLQPATAD